MLKNLLGSYSDNFAIALGLWPVVSFLFTLPILAWLYHRDGRIRLSSAAAAYLSVLYALGLACFTLYPLPSGDSGPGITYGVSPQLIPFQAIADIAKDGMSAVFQIAANVAFFIPLGFIAGRFLRMRLVPTLLLGLGTSLLIEVAQLTGLFGIYPFAYRTFDVDDLINNTLGCAIGYAAFALVRRLLPAPSDRPPETTTHPGFVRRCVAFWIDMMAVVLASLLALTTCQLIYALIGHPSAHPDSAFAPYNIYDIVFYATMACTFVVVELVIPWVHGGQTPGGMFVHMTFETRPRTGWLRGLFYLVRAATIVLALAFPPLMFTVLALFYLFARQMPYDLLPASRSRGAAQLEG